MNSTKYKVIVNNDQKLVKSSELKVGDIIYLEKDQRIPADSLLLAADNEEGTVFIRTD